MVFEVDNIYFYVDEHTTATDGRYELRESLEQEFKVGTFNTTYSKYFPPIFPSLSSVHLKFCDSNSVTLVRAADIVANKLYYRAINKRLEMHESSKFLITDLPLGQTWHI